VTSDRAEGQQRVDLGTETPLTGVGDSCGAALICSGSEAVKNSAAAWGAASDCAEGQRADGQQCADVEYPLTDAGDFCGAAAICSCSEVPVAPDPWDAVVGTGRGGNRSAARVDVQSLLFVVDALDKRSVPLTYSHRLRRAAERIRALTAHAVPVAVASAFAPLGAKPSPNEIVLHKRLSDLYKRHGVDAYCPCGHQLAVQSAARPFRCANCRGRVVGPHVTCGTGHFKACPACAQAVVDS